MVKPLQRQGAVPIVQADQLEEASGQVTIREKIIVLDAVQCSEAA